MPTLFREGPGDYARRRRIAGELLADLQNVEMTGRSSQDRATYDLLRFELSTMCELHDLRAHERPALFPFGPVFSFVHFANMSTLESAADAAVYNERLATLPAVIGDVEATLREGYEGGIRYPTVVLDFATSNLRSSTVGDPEDLPFFGPYVRAANKTLRESPEAQRARELIARELLPALRRHADFFEATLGSGARETFACTDAPQGAAFYAALVRHYTTVDITPDAVFDLGVSEVVRLSADIEAIAAECGHAGDAAGYRAWLASDPQFRLPSKEALREHTEQICKRIDSAIPAFFGYLPRITYGVESMTEALSQRMPPAYAQPNPADRTGPGIYWITALPERLPSYNHVSLALHEAWPGHLMHIALMQELDELPAFRRNGAMRYISCVEGWAVYCESLGTEMGLYETAHQRYGRLESELWRAVRLVVDTGIHARGWSRQEAVDYMAAHLALPLGTISAEVDRYIAMPGQALAYQLGNRKIQQIRERAQRRLGERFSLRAFHDAMMRTGPVTLPVMERLMNDWLESVELRNAT